jgi:hypothetical protein
MSAPGGTSAAELPVCSSTATTATCTIPDPASNAVYWATLTISGPAQDHTSTLAVRYDDQSTNAPVMGTPLANPVLTHGAGTGAELTASQTAAEDHGAYTVDVPITSGWTIDEVSLSTPIAGLKPAACTQTTPIEWSCGQLVDGASYAVAVSGTNRSTAAGAATVSYGDDGSPPVPAQTIPMA